MGSQKPATDQYPKPYEPRPQLTSYILKIYIYI
jgi:hypothetical protein